jgi:hypothetical protein
MKYLAMSMLLVVAFTTAAQKVDPVSIYAHHNQTIFNKGEQIFSKIYLRTPQGLQMQPMNIYVDWYHADGNLLAHQVYLSQLGGAEAGFLIPADYDSAYIRMRMYTMHSLKQIPSSQFFDQVVFVHQIFGSKQAIQNNSETTDLSKSSEDESLQITKLAHSFLPKGRNEWLIESINKDFINLSVSIVEEESFETSPYTILTHFKKPTANELLVKPDFYDALVQVKGQLQLDSSQVSAAVLSFSIFNRGGLPIMDNVPIQKDGSFLIDRLNILDSAQLSIQVDIKGGKKQKIPLSYQQLGLFNTAPLYVHSFNSPIPRFSSKHLPMSYAAYQKNDESEVVVYSTVNNPMEAMDKKYANGLFRGGDAINFNMMTPNGQSFPTIYHYLMGKIPGMQIYFRTDTMASFWGYPEINWRSNYNDEVKIFLNEFMIRPEKVLDININEIAYVKVFKPPFLGAALGAPNGAIAIYTKVGDEGNHFPRESKLTSFMIKGFTRPPTYIQPDYSKANNKAVIDQRKTLLWAPTVHLSKEKPTMTLVYYNNDRSKQHRLIIEGVKQNGEIIRRDWLVE